MMKLKNRMEICKVRLLYCGYLQTDVEYLDNSAENLQVWGVSEEFERIRSFDIAQGRFLSAFEINSGKNICIIGNTIAEELFQGMNPLGRTIQVSRQENHHHRCVSPKKANQFLAAAAWTRWF